jgi:hypothetical protein
VRSGGNKCHRDTMISAPERDWMEWQAGYVCGALLMPASALVETVQLFREEENVPYDPLLASSDLGARLIDRMARTFQTSRDAARVRLIKRRVLQDMGEHGAKGLF